MHENRTFIPIQPAIVFMEKDPEQMTMQERRTSRRRWRRRTKRMREVLQFRLEHGMIPGSHERMSGPECRCGAGWIVFGSRCSTFPGPK